MSNQTIDASGEPSNVSPAWAERMYQCARSERAAKHLALVVALEAAGYERTTLPGNASFSRILSDTTGWLTEVVTLSDGDLSSNGMPFVDSVASFLSRDGSLLNTMDRLTFPRALVAASAPGMERHWLAFCASMLDDAGNLETI